MRACVPASRFRWLAFIPMAVLAVACTGSGTAPAPDNGGRAGPIELPLAEGESVQKLCLSPDDRYLVAAIEDKERAVTLYKWDLQTKERKQLTWAPKYQMVRSLSWTRRGELVAGTEGWIGWFDPETGRLRAELKATLPRHGGLRYEEWDGKELVKCVHHKGDYDKPMTLVGDRALFPDYGKKQVRLVDYKKRGEERLLELPPSARDSFSCLQFKSLAVSADGSTVAIPHCALDPGTEVPVWAWNVKTGKLIHEITYKPRDSAVGGDHLVALSRDGSYLVAAVPGSSPAYVFDVQKGKQLYECRTDGNVFALAVSAVTDAFTCHTFSKRVEVWGMSDGKRLTSFQNSDLRCDAEDVQLSPDGTRLAWGWKAIRVANVPAGK